MLIRYRNVIIDGRDKSGQVEDISDNKALSLIKLGYAERESLPAQVEAQVLNQDEAQSKKRGKRWL